jgi:adenylate isopentenyltransferase (cytokinin synthase)
MLSIKPVVIMGATGMGKTKLSIDISKAIGGEVINADKMQMYAGLDIATNKIRPNDQGGIPHHLIGVISSITDDLSIPSFRSITTTTVESIARRGRVPVLAGGSNSLMHGFLVDHLDPSLANPFSIAKYKPNLRFKSCLLWVHAHEVVLNEYLCRRIDDMVRSGLVVELKEYFDTTMVHTINNHTGLAKAIGVQELSKYFGGGMSLSDSIDEMKANTIALAKTQTTKICHIADVWGWPVCVVDSTEAIRCRLSGTDHGMEDISWERDVSSPAIAIVNKFLHS